MNFGDLPKKPNIMIIITDQQRAVQHWPVGWAMENLPAMRQLMEHGLTFTNGHTNSCTCSPSRVTLFTGLYPAQHGVTQVLEFDDTGNETERMQVGLSSQLQNMAKILKTAGYNVAYKGKWHLTKPVSFSENLGQLYWSDADIAHIARQYGFEQWGMPDAGDNLDIRNMGGGSTNNDGRFVDGKGMAAKYGPQPYNELARESVVNFLHEYDADQPFCLIVSLVNPHDVLAYPGTGQSSVNGIPLYEAGGYRLEDFEHLPIGLPETVNEDLSTKPRVQAEFRAYSNVGTGLIAENDEKAQLDYCRFYAYLSKLVDTEIEKTLTALRESGKEEETIVVRISDHGEMGMAHGRQRQKMYNVYRETLNVPMIISNPLLYPKPQVTDSLASLIDILPTLATITGVPDVDRWTFKGKDLAPILENPNAEVQNYIHFTYDDTYMYVPGPNHIRCIVEKDWKYAVYYDPTTGADAEYEMYNVVDDPLETRNLAHPTLSGPFERERQRLHRKLASVMNTLGTMPYEIVWPKVSGFNPASSFPGPEAPPTDG